jgi:hypothetical protein
LAQTSLGFLQQNSILDVPDSDQSIIQQVLDENGFDDSAGGTEQFDIVLLLLFSNSMLTQIVLLGLWAPGSSPACSPGTSPACSPGS